MVLVTKQEKKAIYQYLMKEGTLVVRKSRQMAQHEAIAVSNLKVQMLCKSMKSKGQLKELFNWQYYYYNLTNEGISAICGYLGLPSNVRPDIYKPTGQKRMRDEADRPRRGFGRGPSKQ